MNRIFNKATALFLCLATAVTFTQLGSTASFAASATAADFTVVNGVLIKYRGTAENVKIPGTVVTIGDYAFQECTEIEKIIIPNSVTSIGRYAFAKCENIEKIAIPDSVTTIGNFAFSECSGLKKLTFSSKLKAIGISSFTECSGLTDIVIPNSVTVIGKNAFEDCSGLKSITIASNIRTIGKDAFIGCGNVTISGYEDTEIQKYAKENSISFKNIGTGSLTLDTKNVAVAPKGSYTVNTKLAGQGIFIKTSSSKSKVAKVVNDGNGHYRVVGLKSGTTYIMFNVYNKSNKLLAHASVKVTVKSGAVSRGDKSSQTARF